MYYKIYVEPGEYIRVDCKNRTEAKTKFQREFKGEGLWIVEYIESDSIKMNTIFYPLLDEWVPIPDCKNE